MGWKYELAIWTIAPLDYLSGLHAGWHYETQYTGNSLAGLARAYWKNRKAGCVKVEIRR